MSKTKFEILGQLARTKRDEMEIGVRAAAEQIGVSHATLSRIERGHVPDLETFSKLCGWLELDPNEILGHRSRISSGRAVHFRKNKSTTPETSKALADLIMAADKEFFG